MSGGKCKHIYPRVHGTCLLTYRRACRGAEGEATACRPASRCVLMRKNRSSHSLHRYGRNPKILDKLRSTIPIRCVRRSFLLLQLGHCPDSSPITNRNRPISHINFSCRLGQQFYSTYAPKMQPFLMETIAKKSGNLFFDSG